MAFTPFMESDRPTMAAFNEKFLECIGAGSKVQSFSYVGTGTDGPDAPNSLTFDFAPEIVMLCYSMDAKGAIVTHFFRGTSSSTIHNAIMLAGILTEDPQQFVGLGASGTTSTYSPWGYKSADGKTFYWYTSPHNAVSDTSQFNTAGTTYYGVAIGGGD